MSTPVTRRAVSSGIAWSVPAVAAAAAAPAFATSAPPMKPEQCKDDIPEGVGPFWPSNGSHSVSSTAGRLVNMTTTYNYAINDLSNKGSVSLYFSGTTAAQNWVTRPYVKLNNGVTLCGSVTLGATGTFVAPAGVSTSLAVLWDNSTNTANDTLWNGVTAHVPFVYWYTVNGTLRSAQYEMLIKYPATNGYDEIARTATISYVKASYGCTKPACPVTAP